ncbi:MAG: hypothetical protein KBA26_06305 [Candidatus Delongbacteria bacterium]|nr:hypothetical protein [Candidatus Delongbacteria bacterium]
MKKNYTYHVISNTHWDREWRFPYQKNRLYLVEMIDRTLEILDQEPEYRAYHLDSQTIVLEDYLQIRPHQAETIRRHVTQGRLLIGPWYILPDEFLVGGENLVRNLLLGHRIAKRFGRVMKVGYSPFSWGQISQLPQIYAGFGIDVIMFYRGINALESPKAEFIWEGPDGTQALGSRFSTMPRYNFFFYIYRPVIHNEQIEDVEYRWDKGGVAIHPADPQLQNEDYSILRVIDEYHPEHLPGALDAIISRQRDDFTTSHIFWAEGHDTSGPDPKTVQLIRDINHHLEDGICVHSTLEEYAAALRREVQRDQLPIIRGERRSSQYDRRSTNLYGYVTSARIYLKQANADCEKWLRVYAEPFYQWAAVMGMDRSPRYLEQAWNLLLQNSAHDSIGGCSLDEIHEDMMNRYKQVGEMARGVFLQAWKYLLPLIDLTPFPSESLFVTLINPNPFPRRAIVPLALDIPASQDQGDLQLEHLDGTKCPIQLWKMEPVEPVIEQMTDRPMYFKMKRYSLMAEIDDIPAFGYCTLRFKPIPAQGGPIPPPLGRMENDAILLENEHLMVTVHPNGTFTLLDKSNRVSYPGLGWFLDEGEAGHAWVHTPVEPILDTRNLRPECRLDQNGPLMASCRISYSWMIPLNLQERRTDQGRTISLPLSVTLLLKKQSRHLDVEIQLENPAEDHRLRWMVPSHLTAAYSWGEGQFDVVARPTARPDCRDWVEPTMTDYPFDHFVDLSDEKKGLALISQGLKEYEVLDAPEQTLALTLLRAFTYIIQPSSKQDYSYQKGSQCPGHHHYRMAIYPHSGNWDQGEVYREALDFNHQIRAFQIGRSSGCLPPSLSFLSINPESIRLSCIKEPEDPIPGSVVIRLYNPTDRELQGSLESACPIRSVHQLTLEEQEIGELPCQSRSVSLRIVPKKIMTLRLLFQPDDN